MDSKLAFLVLLVAGVLVLGVFFSSPPAQGLTESAAHDFILDDIHQNLGADACVRTEALTRTDSGYSGTYFLSVNPNSQCPSVVKRDYTLLPIRFREESLTTPALGASCPVSGNIVYPEEAIRYSAKDLSGTGRISFKAQACAFSFPIGQTACCPSVDYASLNAFANGLKAGSATWIVQWTENGKTLYHALDNTGATVQTSG